MSNNYKDNYNEEKFPVHSAILRVNSTDLPRAFAFGAPTFRHTDCIGYVFRVFDYLNHDYSGYSQSIERRLHTPQEMIQVLRNLGSIEHQPPLFTYSRGRVGHIGIQSDYDDLCYSFTMAGSLLIEDYKPSSMVSFSLPPLDNK